jgi:hypothetical protein
MAIEPAPTDTTTDSATNIAGDTAATVAERITADTLAVLPALPRGHHRLLSAAGNPDWLPHQTGFAELDVLRQEHHRHLAQVGQAKAALTELKLRHRQADRAHSAALKDVHRRGDTPPPDERPSAAERDAERTPLVENLAAAVAVLDEFAERAIETIREHEDEWLATLRGRVSALEQKRHEAERLLDEARREQWVNDRLAAWLKGTADDRGFAPVPLAQIAEPPPSWQPGADAHAFRRHWSTLQPWNSRSEADDEALRSFRSGPPAQRDEQSGKRPQVPVVSPGVSGVTVHPLDDAERFGGEAG